MTSPMQPVPAWGTLWWAHKTCRSCWTTAAWQLGYHKAPSSWSQKRYPSFLPHQRRCYGVHGSAYELGSASIWQQ